MPKHGSSESLAYLGTRPDQKISFDLNGPLTLKYAHRLL